MYNYKDIYTIDFRKLQYYAEVHWIIKDALDFPDYYGENWDAFWDCIVDLVFSYEKVHIEIIGLDVLERKFGEDTSKMFLELLHDAKERAYRVCKGVVTVEIVDGDKRIEIQ